MRSQHYSGERAYALQFEDLPVGIKKQILTDEHKALKL